MDSSNMLVRTALYDTSNDNDFILYEDLLVEPKYLDSLEGVPVTIVDVKDDVSVIYNRLTLTRKIYYHER